MLVNPIEGAFFSALSETIAAEKKAKRELETRREKDRVYREQQRQANKALREKGQMVLFEG